MARKLWAAALALLVGVSAWAGPKVLVVDLTTDFMSSMQVGVLARILRTSELQVEITGTTAVPRQPPAGAPFDLVLLIPEGGEWVWVLPPGFPDELSPALAALVGLVDQVVPKVFRGQREALDPGEDLYALGWAAYFQRIGVLQGLGG